MSSSSRPVVPPRRFHVGRRSTAFDIVDQPLVVVEYIDGVAPGSVDAASPAGVEPVMPFHEKIGPGTGHRAFQVQHGSVMRIKGVERRPVPVEKFVRYDHDLGFVEIDETTFIALSALVASPSLPAHSTIKADLPVLEGTEPQVKWATDIRRQMIAAVTLANRLDLMPAFHRRKYARFYIPLAHEQAQWIAQLEAVLHPPPRNS